jgi:hypothetical protein
MPGPCRRQSRTVAAAAAGLRVRPRWRIPRPNSGHPQGLGERMVVPYRFPGREHGQLAGIRSAPPPPHDQGPDCKGPNLSRVFSVNQWHGCEVSVLCRVLSAKG